MKTFFCLLISSLLLFEKVNAVSKDVELHDWLEMSEDEWPEAENVSGPSVPFYYHHTQQAANEWIGFKKVPDIFENINLTGQPELNFKYWTNSNKTEFVTKSGQNVIKTVPVNETKTWTATKIQLDREHSYGFYGQGPFSVAFKNITIKYSKESSNQTTANNTEIIECNDSNADLGCANLFDGPMLKSAKYFVAKDLEYKQYFPYQFGASVKTDGNYLKISEPGPPLTLDFCIVFAYKAEESLLIVSTSSNFTSEHVYSIEYPQTQYNDSRGEICASYFTPTEPGQIMDFYFRFPSAPVSFQNPETHYVEVLYEMTSSTKNTLSEGVYLDEHWNYLFLHGDDHEHFRLNQTEKSIMFHVDNLHQQKVPKDGILVSYFRTQWIKSSPAFEDQIRLGMTVVGDFAKDYCKATVVISTPTQANFIVKSLRDLIDNAIHIWTFDDIIDYFKMTIKIELNVTQIPAADRNFQLKLANFTINDPCFEAESHFRMCQNGGKHKRNYEHFTCNCACAEGFYGKDCEQINYCYQKTNITDESTTGHQYCIHGQRLPNCKNLPEQKSWECECEDESYRWEPTFKKCVSIDLSSCEVNEVLQLLPDQPIWANNLVHCVCMDGFIHLNGTCIKYNQCERKHRELHKDALIETCASKEAKCVPGGTAKSDDYECLCKEGFVNESGIKSSKAVCQPKPS